MRDALTVASGATLIADERSRQITTEGWTSQNDEVYLHDELTRAAMVYVVAGQQAQRRSVVDDSGAYDGGIHWPWSSDWWKPSDDPIRNLVKAGALIAAEIDRLQRGQRLEAVHETGVHKPFTDDGVTYCGFDGHEGCGELWPCSTVRAGYR